MAVFPSGEFFHYLEGFIDGPLKNRIWWRCLPLPHMRRVR
jgi:hypothetical protein